MQPHVLSRRNSIFTVFGICFIALAVFGWGLQYKMSLYETSSHHKASVPIAKLLPPKETVSSVRTPNLNSPDQPPVVPLSIVAIAAMMSTFLGGWNHQSFGSTGGRYRELGWYSGSVFFSFRPPPSAYLA